MTRKFEEMLGELKEVVKKMEDPDTGLDESIALYEEGAKCLKACQGRLAQAEARIKMLVEGASGPEQRDFYVAEGDEKPSAEADDSAAAKPRKRTKEPKGRGLF
jgi:exodeoxyribonuclease VII small subunit